MVGLPVLAVLPFWHVWMSSLSVGVRDGTFGYLLLVPVGVAVLMWQRRGRLDVHAMDRNWLGPVVLVAAGVIYAVAEYSGWYSAWYFSAIVAVVGGVLSAWGTQVWRVWGTSLALLLLTIPPPPSVIRVGTIKLMQWGTMATEDLLRILGVAVERFSNLLVVEGHEINVVDACSGIRSFFALLAVMSFFVVSLPFRAWVRVGTIVLIPLAVFLGNIVRLLLTALAYGAGYDDAADVVHDILGFVTFALMVGFFLGAYRVLSWAGLSLFEPSAKSQGGVGAGRGVEASAAPGNPIRAYRLAAAVCVGLLGLTFTHWPAFYAIDTYHGRVSDAVNAIDFNRLEGVVARDSQLPAAAEILLVPNASRTSTLHDRAAGDEVQVSLIHCYFVRDMWGHTPTICYPNAGWAIRQQTVHAEETGEGPLNFTEYRFLRITQEDVQSLFVRNFFVTASGQSHPDEASAIGAWAARSSEDVLGVMQVSLIFSHQVDTVRRDAWTRRVASAITPALVVMDMSAEPAVLPVGLSSSR